MTRQEQQKYLDMALAAIEKTGLQFDDQDPVEDWDLGFEKRANGVLIMEPDRNYKEGLSMYFDYEKYGISGRVEFRQDVVKFIIYECDYEPFLLARFPYDSQYEKRLNEFVYLLKQNVIFKDKCSIFSDSGIEGPYLG